MRCLLTYGFEASLISNIKCLKPSLDEDKKESGKNNEGKITSKSSYQISIAVISVSNPGFRKLETRFLAIFYYPKPVFFSTTKPGYLKKTGIAVVFKY